MPTNYPSLFLQERGFFIALSFFQKACYGIRNGEVKKNRHPRKAGGNLRFLVFGLFLLTKQQYQR
ncbi:hypothetical protein [Stenoxybacter acetivorans]|uniref:hypothetical protein n=1 Tax=Stenoxybacter acetivorans TaxID=422441 RepID=UPI00056950F2|nr:hypothetical protein [Stenoxybacter acetivorans]